MCKEMALSIWEALAVFAAGIGAGTINTIVGSGTLLTFPVLLATGLPRSPPTSPTRSAWSPAPSAAPSATATNCAARPGGCSASAPPPCSAASPGRSCCSPCRPRRSTRSSPSWSASALVLVLFQPRLAAAIKRRREARGTEAHPEGGAALLVGLFLASMYGGYFGAAQGVLYLSLMGLLLPRQPSAHQRRQEHPRRRRQRHRGRLLPLRRRVQLDRRLLIAVGSTIGGQIGAKVGRRLKPAVLRGVIIAVGIVAILQLTLK